MRGKRLRLVRNLIIFHFMADIEDNRYNNLKLLLEEYGSQKHLADALGFSSAGFISALVRKEKDLSEKTCRKWEKLLKKPRLWFDSPNSVASPDEFDYFLDPNESQDLELYTRVTAETNAQIRARNLKLPLAQFEKVVRAAYRDLTQRPRDVTEAVKFTLDTAMILAPS